MSFRPRSALVAHELVFGQQTRAFDLADTFSSKGVCCYDIFSGPLLCATVINRPGHIRTVTEDRIPFTTAHNFADYRQHDAVSEDVLLYHLRLSECLSQFLRRCISDGFDVAAGQTLQRHEGTRILRRAFRLKISGRLIGALWEHPGQLSCLDWQPTAGTYEHPQSMLTVYTGRNSKFFELATLLLGELQEFEAVRAKLEQSRIKVESVLYRKQEDDA